MTEGTPIDPLPGEGPPQAIPPAASAPGAPTAGTTPPPQAPPAAAQPTDTSLAAAADSSARTMAMLTHLTALSALIGIPFGNVLGPLVVWLMKRDESAFVDDHGKESLNFEISISIYFIVAAILIFVVIGIPLLIGLAIFWLVVVVIASIRANEGKIYRYPLTIRFIK